MFKKSLRIAALLTLTAIVILLLNYFIYLISDKQIKSNIEQHQIQLLARFIPAEKDIDTDDMLQSKRVVNKVLKKNIMLSSYYVLCDDGQFILEVAELTTSNGYNGDITLLVGKNDKNEVTQALVTAHKETPGLGDQIDADKSDWSQQFHHTNAKEHAIALKKHGGDIDAIAGATISSSAVTSAIDAYAREVIQMRCKHN